MDDRRDHNYSASEYTDADTDAGEMSDVIGKTGSRVNMTPEQIDELNNETCSSTSTMPGVRRQPLRAAKKRPHPSADDINSEASTASDLESIASQQSLVDTDMSETSSIGYSAPKCKFIINLDSVLRHTFHRYIDKLEI